MHEMVKASTKAFSKDEKGAMGAVLAGDEVQLFQHRTWSQQQEYEEFLRRREAKFIREAFGGKEEPKPNEEPGCV